MYTNISKEYIINLSFKSGLSVEEIEKIFATYGKYLSRRKIGRYIIEYGEKAEQFLKQNSFSIETDKNGDYLLCMSSLRI